MPDVCSNSPPCKQLSAAAPCSECASACTGLGVCLQQQQQDQGRSQHSQLSRFLYASDMQSEREACIANPCYAMKPPCHPTAVGKTRLRYSFAAQCTRIDTSPQLRLICKRFSSHAEPRGSCRNRQLPGDRVAVGLVPIGLARPAAACNSYLSLANVSQGAGRFC